MSSSQYLYRSRVSTISPKVSVIERSFSSHGSVGRDQFLTALSIVHARWASSSTFELGQIDTSSLSTAHVIVEATDSVEKLSQHLSTLSFESTAQLPENCGVVLRFGDGLVESFLQQNVEQLEVVYHFDPNTKACAIHFREDLFDARTVEMWMVACERILSQICNVSDSSAAGNSVLQTAIGQLEVFDSAIGRVQIANGQINDDQANAFYSLTPSTEFTFHGQFERQVKSQPERIAVWAKDQSTDADGVEWSYQQLNRQSNAIARYLIDAGISAEDSVGIVMHRRVCLLAALIGVMKAGGRYVALEPELPTDRLGFMADDSEIKFLISERNLSDRVDDLTQIMKHGAVATTLIYDSDEFNQFRESIADLDENPDTGVNSRQACYTIYTSGSTGNPKGVEVCHHSLVSFCHVFVKQLGFTADDTSIAMSTIAFDASVGELYPLLLVGGRVAIGHKQIGANGKQLAALIEQVDGTYMAATPTSLRVLVASGWESSPRLTVIAGGEAVTPLVRDEIMPRVKRLVNGYGPTECTVYSSFGILTDRTEPVPLGGPLINARLYVLDDFGKPVPPMVRGNLFIGGQCVARGYLNRPELTAEKFVADPFVDQAAEPDARMYDSGDVVYWDHDGTLFYIGRSDHQVKLRGYRIELGEIESRLKKHPNVQDAVAMVREDVPGQQRLVAYTILDKPTADADLQAHLLVDMPDYMVPTWFVPLDAFPTNANLKLDRRALPVPETILDGRVSDETPSDRAGTQGAEAQAELASGIASIWGRILNRRIQVRDHVFRMGADSLTSVKFQLQLQQELGHEISVGEVFQYPTPQALAAVLLPGAETVDSKAVNFANRSANRVAGRTSQDIAVIGMAARFPGAPDIDSFWDNLINGVESIGDFSEEELIAAGVSRSEFSKPNYVRRGSRLDNAYDFEPEFFGVTRPDAEIVSPQLRLFMKTVWEALEHGGYPIEPAESRIGVYAGGGLPNYLAPWRHVDERQRLQRLVGNGADFLATRTSYALGLTGPSVAIQTACSTSLVAVAQACQAIRSGQCEFAIAGGSSFSWPHAQGYTHGEGLIYSSDGHCRAFDSRASGTIFSHGAGAVLLRPLEDAIAAGDTIHAVIRGVAVNNDGDRKGGYAAPSIDGQTEVIQMALEDAQVSARDISCMEAHGTGTIIGDPIEIAGLSQAWRAYTDDTQFCSIGSVKTNIGHADAAAGIAGLLKIILCLKNQQLVPNLNYDQPNPAINFEKSPFVVQTESTDWTTDRSTRLAAISAFGMGGTNAHVIVAQGHPAASCDSRDCTTDAVAPADTNDRPLSSDEPVLRMIPFSARTDRSLEQLHAQWREDKTALKLRSRFDDIAFTLQQGRKHFARRSFAICDSKFSLATALENTQADDVEFGQPQIYRSTVNATDRKVVFMFTGQGAQYTQMAKDLYRKEPVFRETLDQCDQILQSKTDLGLLDWLFAEDPQADINQTQFAQLALFSVAYAQSMLWKSWGVQPDAMLGHSIGEYVAVAVSGVMSLEDALCVVAHRGRLMQSMLAGSMLAVMHGKASIESLLAGRSDLDLAVINNHTVAVVAGTDQAIDRFASELEGKGINSKKLHTSHAFHSAMMEPMLEPFGKVVDAVKLNPPTIPFLSNVTGTWITPEEATDPGYYPRQIRSTVRFADNLAALAEDEQSNLLLIEMGPGTTLTQLARTQFSGTGHVAISTIPHPKERDLDSRLFARVALGRAWAAGLELDWSKIEPPTERPRRVALPTYCFDEQTYRAESESIGESKTSVARSCWYNVPTWKQVLLDAHQSIDRADGDTKDEANQNRSQVWLVLASENQIPSEVIARTLQSEDASIKLVRIETGNKFLTGEVDQYFVRPGEQDDYRNVVEAVCEKYGGIDGAIHGWTLETNGLDLLKVSEKEFWDANQRASIGLAWLAKALGEVSFEKAVPLTVLTSRAASIDPTVVDHPAHRGLIGGAAVIQKEYPALVTKVLNISPGQVSGLANSGQLASLLTSNLHEPLLVYTAGQWWKYTYEQSALAEQNADGAQFADDGVYVITGGLGGLARNMALELAQNYQGLKIGLLARTVLPNRETWPELLKQTDEESAELRQRIADVLALEELCAVRIVQCDVTQPQPLADAMRSIAADFGPIDGLLHTAGTLRDGALATKDSADLRSVYSSKALSAVLCCREILANHADMKFVVLFSSIASDIGLFGQFDYSSANAYLDGLASVMNNAGVATRSINWPAFRDVGMAARTQVNLTDQSALQEELAANSFAVNEGAEALVAIIANANHRRVVLSHEPFAKRHEHYIDDGRETRVKTRAELASVTHDDSGSAEDRMLNIWREQFGNPELTADDDYFELGGDSLMAIGMIAQIEQVFGRLIPISQLINSPTAKKLVKKMGLAETQDGSSENHESNESDYADWIIRMRESDSKRPPVFLIHGADGAVMFYRDFVNRLKSDRTIYAVESPFLQDVNFELQNTLEAMAVDYVNEIVKVQPVGPYTIGGYSFGGILAVEVAQQLIERGERVEMTVLYDVPNPDRLEHSSAVERLKSFWSSQETSSALSKSIKLTQRFGQAVRDRATQEIENQLASTRSQNDQAGGFWRHKKCREHHMRIEENYKPRPLNTRVGLVVATGNSSKFRVDETLGWSSVISDLTRLEVSGSHLELFNDPYLNEIVTATDKLLSP